MKYNQEWGVNEHPTSPFMYLSKAQNLFFCPRKYFYVHHLWLIPKETPQYFRFGTAIHEGIRAMSQDHNLERAIITIADSDLTEEEKSLAYYLLEIFHSKYADTFSSSQILFQEIPLLTQVESNYIKNWVVKPDRVVQTPNEDIWLLEYKTTSGYGAATANYYQESMQTLTYFFLSQEKIKLLNKNVKGTKLIIFLKKGSKKKDEERVIFDDIFLTNEDKEKTNQFIHDTLSYLDFIEEKRFFPRFATNCHNSFGSKCEYASLCWTQGSKGYVKELIDMCFKIECPEDHLELDTITIKKEGE